MRIRLLPYLLVALLPAGVAVLPACSGKSGAAVESRAEAAPVTVAKVVQRTVPVQIRAIGRVEAYSTIAVKSQVDGQLARVYFTEGQFVKKGDPLFLIDPRSYEAKVKEAEAALAKDIAQAKNADLQAHRYEVLFKARVVSQQEYDDARTKAQAAAEAARQDRAALDNAKVQLSYCHIDSPINGRTGSLQIHAGNLMKANGDNPIVTINQLVPIHVTFSVPERHLPDIKKYMAIRQLDVEAIIPGDSKDPEPGALSFLDNTVDVSTGTVKLKGSFPNSEKRLWPGQFVNVILTLTERPNSIVVPSRAVQTGQSGEYVFVVKPDFTVESRPVIAGDILDDSTVIESGLKAGETVVTDGQLRLVPGARVEIKNAQEAARNPAS
jgi:multidrug efflux system membrane fusion protein